MIFIVYGGDGVSWLGRALKEVLKREKKFLKNVSALEKQFRRLWEQLRKEEEGAGLNEKLLQLNNAQNEAEAQLMVNMKEKE